MTTRLNCCVSFWAHGFLLRPRPATEAAPSYPLAVLLLSPAGTSADTSISLLMEPSFVSQSGSSGANTSAAAARPPLYFALPNCSALSDNDRATLAQVGQVRAKLQAGDAGPG